MTTTKTLPETFETFEFVASNFVQSLNVTVEEYVHKVTRAKHFHFKPHKSHTDENVFMVALKTMPQDNSGVAHILEHTVLCGSEKYPVRDPFFSMLRRSVQTFMNAFTGSDYTAYPFASQNKTDFRNLLDVYLDAVFFARIRHEDFMQEGWRLDFEVAGDTSSNLVYKGIVYNEMKGALSSPVDEIYHDLSQYLFKGTTYEFNAGGNPADISNLTYDQLKQFYKIFYHPSNSVFMTYGDIPACEHQATFEANALGKFGYLDVTASLKEILPHYYSDAIPDLPSQSVKSEYHSTNADMVNGSNEVVLSWVLGNTSDVFNTYATNITIAALLGDDAAPLAQAIEAFCMQYGGNPSELCGLNDSQSRLQFSVGFSNVRDCDVEVAKTDILNALQEVAEVGIEHSRLESILNRFEMGHLDIKGGFPYGLRIMMGCMPSVKAGLSPVEALEAPVMFEKLAVAIKDPEFIKGQIKALLDTAYKIEYVARANPNIAQIRDTLEQEKLAEIRKNLNEAELDKIKEVAAQVEAHQNSVSDLSILPNIEVSDLTDTVPQVDKVTLDQPYGKLTTSLQGTNGVTYMVIKCDIPEVAEEDLGLVSLYADLVGEVGVGERSYTETQVWLNEKTSAVSAVVELHNHVVTDTIVGSLTFKAKALNRFGDNLVDVLTQTVKGSRFDEASRIRYIIESMYNSMTNSIADHALTFAKLKGSSHLSKISGINELLTGESFYRYLKNLYNNRDDVAFMYNLSKKLKAFHASLQNTTRHVVIVSSSEDVISKMCVKVEACGKEWGHPSDLSSLNKLNLSAKNVDEAYLIDAQVGYNAMVYEVPSSNHPDIPHLMVLGHLLRNGFIHTAIREKGGAYGGRCDYSGNKSFVFSSYRDPRSIETFADFERSIDWILNVVLTQAQVDEAILNVVQLLDKPHSPVESVLIDVIRDQTGISLEQRKVVKQSILRTNTEDIKKVAWKYLVEPARRVAFVPEVHGDVLKAAGFEVDEV